MSGSGLTPDDYRRYQEHMKRKQERERRARAEQEKAEQERTEQERAAKERAAKERAAGEQATFPLPVPGGSLGSWFMVVVKKLGLPTPTESPSCVRDGPVFSASGQFLSEIAKFLDGKTFEGVDFNFNETLLLEVNRADDRLATVTRSISNYSYHVCRHISHLSEIISSEPSFLAPFLEFIGYQKSKETVIENETKGFLSTLYHGNTTRSEMINQTRAVYESIGKLQIEFCEGSDKVLNIKTDVSEKLSAKKAALQAQEKHTALRQYVARRLHGIDIDTLKMENVAIQQRLDEARDLRIHPALGCSGGGIFWSKMRKLEKALKGHDRFSKETKAKAEWILAELQKDGNWKAAGEEISEAMKKYNGTMNELYYGIT
ncbi:hypothetical protein FMEXI_1660 [Fusarium mexicanum]|uniref:Uncharacterized protein n=1 Tax=Fusarium mexicanum TaxID=751941 RepID=A0A8H5JJG8_9HYPO|nr:hypothetical protein FMEXI_1660 [Fusarium mexicanum]